MATKKVIEILDLANTVLNDTTKVRWPEQELLEWYNAAQKAIVSRRPDATAVNADFACSLGTKQTIPADGLRLIKVTRNTSGPAITVISEDILNQQIRDWHDDSTPSNDVKHYIYDDRDPRNFYVYPAAAAAHSIEIVYSSAPIDVEITDFENDTTLIDLADTYVDPLVDYILMRAYSKDADYSGNAQRAAFHLNAFNSALGDKTQVDAAVSPNA